MTKIGPIGDDNRTTSNPALELLKRGLQFNSDKYKHKPADAGAFVATLDDFAKKGQVPAPGLTEGGSVWTS